MKAVVSGQISFKSKDCPSKMLERLRRELSFPNPEYVSRKRLGRFLGNIPETIACFEEHVDGFIHIPRGAIGLLRQMQKEFQLPLIFDDRRVVREPISITAPIQLRPYQVEAVHLLKRGVQGVLLMPCGSGKTLVGAALIAAIGQPTIVIIHTRDLLEQWNNVLKTKLGITAGQIAEGKMDIKDVTLAMIQTLAHKTDSALPAIGQNFGCIIVEEAHHVPAISFRDVLAYFPGRYRYGLTATPEREDGLTRLIDLVIGPCLFQINQEELIDQGYLKRPSIIPLYSSFTFDYRGEKDHARLMKALIADDKRNRLIEHTAITEALANHSVLILSGRVEHCRLLLQRIRAESISAELLVGAISKSLRQDILQNFREGIIQVLIASTLADEGLDLPRLDRIILAYPGRAKGRIIQRLGRLMRPHPGKSTPILYDVVDSLIPLLARQYAVRKQIYDQVFEGKANKTKKHKKE